MSKRRNARLPAQTPQDVTCVVTGSSTPFVEPESRPTALTSAGIALVEQLAAQHRGQRSIAAALGVPRRTFRDILDRQEEVLLALERGQAAAEEELRQQLVSAARKGQLVAAIYLTKTQHGWVEGAPAEGSRPNVVIQLPDALDERGYQLALAARRPPSKEAGPESHASLALTVKSEEGEKA